MAVTHHNDVKKAIADAVLGEIDEDTGAADLVLQTAGTVAVATLVFNDPAAPAASTTGVLTFDNTPTIEDTNATGNASPVTKFVIRSGTNVEKVYGSVGTATPTDDIALSSTTIGAGDTVQVTSLTYTAPP